MADAAAAEVPVSPLAPDLNSFVDEKPERAQLKQLPIFQELQNWFAEQHVKAAKIQQVSPQPEKQEQTTVPVKMDVGDLLPDADDNESWSTFHKAAEAARKGDKRQFESLIEAVRIKRVKPGPPP